MIEGKTPKFDLLLEKKLNDLRPGSRNCAGCKRNFILEEGDVSLLKLLRVPESKFCPDCRHKHRLAFSNYSNIYKRKCDFPEHSDIMISLIAPCIPWVTYDYDSYYSDKWDPLSYGQSIEKKPFFEQFLELEKKVPQPGVRRGANSPNSDFSFYGKDMKDCYYVFGGRRSEDIMYSSSIYDSKHVIDSYFLRQVEIGFDNVTTSDCYKCNSAYFSSNCLDCDFIYDCRNCNNCFGCVNLRNKSYCWFNESLSKEEYQKRRKEVDLGKRSERKKYSNKFWDFIKTNPVRATRVYQSENVSGNDIKRSKNCQNVFQIEDSENVRHSFFVIMSVKDSMDIGFSGHDERVYYSQNTSSSSNMKFSYAVKQSSDSEYLIYCNNCHNCFGCIGLNDVSYAIFNKKYEPEEYWSKLDELKADMLENGEYGEYFPMAFSVCAYNSSLANVVYKITEEEAKKEGLFWQSEIDVDTKDLKKVNSSDLPDDIKEAGYELCDLAIIGDVSLKPFRITKREVDIYKRNGISLPLDAPYQRMVDRFKILNNFKISKELCYKCGNSIDSSYKTSEGFKPYCEKCYQEDIL